MLMHLLDSDDEDAHTARGPRGWLGGWPPAPRPNGSSLIAEPTDPYDPLWTIVGYPWPRPPFGGGAPIPGWPYPTGRPGPWDPRAQGGVPRLPPIVPWPAFPHGGAAAATTRPLPFWLEPPNRAAVPQAPAVPGLDALLAMDDVAEDASVSAPEAAPGTALDGVREDRVVVAQAGSAADWPQMPITPGQDTIPDDIEREFRALARYGRSLGADRGARRSRTFPRWFW